MTVLAPVLGGLLIAVTLNEVFHTLFHPAGEGRLASLVFRAVWKLARPGGKATLRLAGPLAMLTVIACWGALLIVGWALVYYPFMPGSFLLATGLEPAKQTGPVDAMYFSLVTQATLGYGDIVPRENVLRIVAPVQAIIGFGMFTAAVTWVLSVYPALGRQRATAAVLSATREAGARLAPRRLEQSIVALATCRVDLVQYPSAFYFLAPDSAAALSASLPWLHDATSRTAADGDGEAVDPARELLVVLDQFAAVLSSQYGIPGTGTAAVLEAYAERQDPDRTPAPR